MKTTSQNTAQNTTQAAGRQRDHSSAQANARRTPEAGSGHTATGSVLALQRSIGNRAVTRLVQEGGPAIRTPKSRSGVAQRLPNATGPSSATAASAPTAGPVGSSANSPQTGSRPPVVFGMDTTSRRIYASVTVPGHAIAEIAAYLYGTSDHAAELQARNQAPAQVQSGRNLELIDATLTPAAQQAINSARENGTLLRSAGMPVEDTSSGQITVYRFTANGQAFELTQAQYQAFLTGQSAYFTRKASYFRDLLGGQLETRNYHVNRNSRLIRGISDWMGNVEVPPTTNWTEPMGIAQAIIAELASGDVTPEKIGQSAQRLATVVAGYTSASRAWHHYIEGTIAGAGRTAADLEVVRDTSFMIAAGLAGAAAAPVVLPLAGSGLAAVDVTGTTATVLSGATAIGAGAVAGGTVRGGLEVAAPNPQNNAGAFDRFRQQFGRGAVAGGIGAAGALAAPGVSGAISQRLFGAAPEALTGIGARTAVGALSGLTIGIPSGALDAAINNVPALASGRISAGEYLERMGWGAVAGAAFGTVFGALGGALSRPRAPSSGLTTPEPPAPSAASPDFAINPPRVNPTTGEITQTATHLASGETMQMRLNPATGEVTMTRMSTGEVMTVRQPTSRQLPAGEVTPTGQGGAQVASPAVSPPSPAAATPALPPGPTPPLPVPGSTSGGAAAGAATPATNTSSATTGPYDAMSLRNLRARAVTDPEAVEALRLRYRAMSDNQLAHLARDGDALAESVYSQRIPPNEQELQRILGSDYRPPHEASATAYNAQGNIIWSSRLHSGNMTPAERALGYPRSSLATHTEVRAITQAPLAPGVRLTIIGQYDPCGSCQRAMAEAARSTGATIVYWWPGGEMVFTP